METPRRARSLCNCIPSLPTSSAILLLSLILPASSFAQLTSSNIASNSSHSSSALQTSSVPTSPTSTPNTTQPNPAATTTSIADEAKQPFSYYFLVAAVAAVIFCLAIMWFGQRKRRKQALIRAHSQRALAQDVAGYRQRFGRPRPRHGWGSGYGIMHSGGEIGHNRVEGLDENGEAPPAYFPKPPSIRTSDTTVRPGSGQSEERRRLEEMELEDMTRPRYEPPKYHEAMDEEAGIDNGNVDVTRLETVGTAYDRLGPSRRL